MDEPTLPYAVAKRAGVPRTRSSPCARRRRPRRGGTATVEFGASDATRERYSGPRLGMDRDDEWDDQDGDDVRDLDHRVDRRAGRVLVGISDCVPRYRRGV